MRNGLRIASETVLRLATYARTWRWLNLESSLIQTAFSSPRASDLTQNCPALTPIDCAQLGSQTLEEPGGLLGIDEPARGVIKLERPFDAELQLLGQV